MTNNSDTNTYILIQGMLTCILALCSVSTFAQDKLKTQKMTTSDFTTTIQVDQTPEEVFNAINNVRGWWSEEIEGSTDKLNDEFRYHYQDVHRCKMKIIEFIPNEKVVWLVLDNYFKFTKDKSEWTGTKISFEIAEQDNKPGNYRTRLRFTHVGLDPGIECFDSCSNSWSQLIQQSLFSLITTGKAEPIALDEP